MFTRWTKGLSDQEIKEFQTSVVSAQKLLKKIKEVAEEELSYTENASLDKDNYTLPAWPYFQADVLGQQRAYNKVLKLINNLILEEK